MMVLLDDENYEKIISDSQKLVLIDFWTTRCDSCRFNAPIVHEISKELSDKVLVCKMNVDSSPYAVGKLDVHTVPSVWILKDGKIIARLDGVVTKAAIFQFVEQQDMRCF